MSPPSLRPVTHVLFDMDGLLLDTEELYSDAYRAVMASAGSSSEYTFEFKVRNIMGRKPVECAEKMVSHYGLALTPDEFVARLEKEQEKRFPDTTWLPGVQKLVHHLYKVCEMLVALSLYCPYNNLRRLILCRTTCL